MAWEKSPTELVERFRNVAPGGPMAVEKQMFGYPAAFVNGHMFMGLHEHRFTMRLSEAAQAEVRALGATDFTPMEGRSMKNFVVLPDAVVKDEEQLRAWVACAYAEAEAMPPKEAKPKAARTKRAG